jgi:hypothetical protein
MFGDVLAIGDGLGRMVVDGPMPFENRLPPRTAQGRR